MKKIEGKCRLDPNTNFYIHFEPQYDVLSGTLSIPLHYEIDPYVTEKCASKNLDSISVERFRENRRQFIEELRKMEMDSFAFASAENWNQIDKVILDLKDRTLSEAAEAFCRVFPRVEAAIDTSLKQMTWLHEKESV